MRTWLPFQVVVLLLTITAVNAASEEAGSKLYESYCSGCHGPEGKGVPNVFPALNDQDFLNTRDDAFIKEVISKGKPGTMMQAFSKAQGGPLEESEIEDIVAFIRSWQVTGETPVPPEEEKPVLLGEELYNARCAGCHGEGGKGTEVAPSLVGSKFVAENDAAVVKKLIEEGVADRGMPPWKDVLSDVQIDSLVTLLKGWEKEEIGVHLPQWDIGLIVFALLFAVMLLVYLYKIT